MKKHEQPVMPDRWKQIVRSPEAAALFKLVLHIHDLCDHDGEVTEFLPTLLHQLAQLLDVQTAAVTVKDQDERQRLLARYDRGGSTVPDELLLTVSARVTAEGRTTQESSAAPFDNMLALPICRSSSVLGAIILANKTSGAFGDYDDIVLTLVERRMAGVIYDWVKRREHRLIALENRVLKTLDDIREQTDDQNEALDKMIATVIDSVDAVVGFITVYDSESDRHLPGGKTIRGNLPMSRNDYRLIGGLIRQAKEEKRPLLRHALPSSEIESILAAPMYINDRFLGATVLINKTDGSRFSLQDLSLVESVNRIIGSFLFQNEKLNRLSRLVGTEARRDVEEALMGRRPDRSIGRRIEITMMFADIRDYSRLTKDMDPTTAVRMLNDFFSVVTPIVISHGGMVDKYVGDQLVALFTQSNPTGSHELMAVEAALQMQKELALVNKEWEAAGRPHLDIGIGIHTGEVVLGQIGSYERKDYTAVGSNMNFAARLVAAAGPRQIIISERTLAGLKGRIAVRRLPPMEIKGFGTTTLFIVEGYSPAQF